jgi:anti-sigma factor RsiW
MWSMRGCRRYRLLLALHAGSDLEAKDRELVERHARVCPDCRDHWSVLRDTRAILEQAAERKSPFPVRESLWREVCERLPPRRRNAPSVFRAAPDGSFGWRDPKNWALMTVSACVCVMLTLVLQTFPRGGAGEVAQDQFVPAGGAAAVPVLGPSPLHGPIPLGDPRWSRSLLDDRRLGQVLSELPGGPEAAQEAVGE